MKNNDKSKFDEYMDMPEVEIEVVIDNKTLANPSVGITKKYKKILSKKIINTKCISSWYSLTENCLVIILKIKKKLNIGNNKVKDKINICKSVTNIFDKFSAVIKPPEEIVVRAIFNESKSLKLNKLKIKIIKIVVKI